MYAVNQSLSNAPSAVHIEKKLFKLLDNLMPVFYSSEIREVKNFIDLCEYGLALQVAVDIIDEKKKEPPKVVFDLLYDLAKSMSSMNVKYVKVL